MKKLLWAILPLIALTSAGCLGGFLHEEKLTGNIYLVADSEMKDMTVSYKSSEDKYVVLVYPTVYSVGFDDRFVIAKQHLANDKSKNTFFIVPHVSADSIPKAVGPLTEAEFLLARNKLKVPTGITFTKTFEELE